MRSGEYLFGQREWVVDSSRYCEFVDECNGSIEALEAIAEGHEELHLRRQQRMYFLVVTNNECTKGPTSPLRPPPRLSTPHSTLRILNYWKERH
jgi:hypothetical protein